MVFHVPEHHRRSPGGTADPHPTSARRAVAHPTPPPRLEGDERTVTESAASEKPTLLFRHGVGKVDRDDAWRAPLDATLARVGYPGLDSVEVIAPKYAHILRDWDEKAQQPAVTVKPPRRDAARQNRRDFERRVSAVEHRLAGQSQGAAWRRSTSA